MPRPETDHFPIQNRNRVRRAHYDRETVYDILDSAMLCHIAYVIDGQPYCTPTLHWREDDQLYWYGSSASRMMKHLAQGVSVCLTVSHLDALVLARSAFNHSVDYRSALCFGVSRLIEDPREKDRQLAAMIERFYPDRNPLLRPMTDSERKQTKVIAMTIETATAKCRAKGVVDEQEDLNLPIWAGVIPFTTVTGPTTPCPHNRPGVLTPEHIGLYRENRRLDDILRATQQHYEEN